MNAAWTRPRVLVAHTSLTPHLWPRIATEVSALHATSVTDLPAESQASVEVLVGHQFPPGVLT